VAEEVGDPLGILYIGLPSRHILDVTGIDHPDGEFLLQKVVDGLPKDPGALHGHVSDLERGKPIRKQQQVFGHCPELANLFPLYRLAGGLSFSRFWYACSHLSEATISGSHQAAGSVSYTGSRHQTRSTSQPPGAVSFSLLVVLVTTCMNVSYVPGLVGYEPSCRPKVVRVVSLAAY